MPYKSFKSSESRFPPGDRMSPRDYEGSTMLVQIIEFTEPIATKFTRENNEEPKPAVRLNVVPITETVPQRRGPAKIELVDHDELFSRVMWWNGAIFDRLEAMVNDGDVEIGDVFLMRLEKVEPKSKGGFPYLCPVPPDEDDEDSVADFTKEFGDPEKLFPLKEDVVAEAEASRRASSRRRPERGNMSRALDEEEDRDAPSRRDPRRDRDAPSRRAARDEVQDEPERSVSPRARRATQDEAAEAPARRVAREAELEPRPARRRATSDEAVTSGAVRVGPGRSRTLAPEDDPFAE